LLPDFFVWFYKEGAIICLWEIVAFVKFPLEIFAGSEDPVPLPHPDPEEE